jgi:hypothetical protein
MSCFVVSNAHIDALVSVTQRNGFSYYYDGDWKGRNNTTAAKIGQILLNQNLRSYNSRYREDNKPVSYGYPCQKVFNYSTVELLKACNCYDYQACETHDYEKTEAKAIITAIKEHLIRELDGYEDADWEITE